jgi:hypothetical protein
VKSEDDPLDPDPPKTARETHAAMSHLDQAVTDAGGIALRYGGFYGAPNDDVLIISPPKPITGAAARNRESEGWRRFG